MSLAKRWMIAALAGLMANAPAFADQHGAVRFESGGATYEDVEALNQRAASYSFKLTLAAKGSGAYLADVDVVIVTLPQRVPVVQHRTEGPLLLAALPPGRYEVSATFRDVLPGSPPTVRRNVVVPRRGMVQTVMHFNTGD